LCLATLCRWQVITGDYPSLPWQQQDSTTFKPTFNTDHHITRQQQSCVQDKQKLLATIMINLDHAASPKRWQYE